MPRGFKGNGPDERTSFTLTAALPSRPGARPADDLDDDAATQGFAEAPVKRLYDHHDYRSEMPFERSERRERDRESLTLTIASPLSSPSTSSRPRGYGAPGASMSPPRVSARYILSEPIGTGGMATVHLGVRTDGDRRVYAIKRLHSQFAQDEYFAQMLMDEAAIAARIRHENVVNMYGAGIVGEDMILVMEYVSGLTVADLIKEVHPQQLPPRMLAAIFAGALRGLHAAHEAFDEHGRPLDIIHRDVSPQNIHVGADGVTRVLDFGIAKAEHRVQTTRVGELKGKTAYMAPEQLTGGGASDRRVDVRAAGVVLWEALTSGPLFHAENEAATMARVMEGCSTPPSEFAAGVPPELDDIVMRALSMRPEDRFSTALEMAEALDAVFGDDTPPSHEIAAWLTATAADTLCEQWDIRANLLGDIPLSAPRQPRQPPQRTSGQPPPRSSAPVPPPRSSAPVPPPRAPEFVPFDPPGGDRHAETSRLATRRAATVRVLTGEGLSPRTHQILVAGAVFAAVFLAIIFVVFALR